jgi:hypothetical protein
MPKRFLGAVTAVLLALGAVAPALAQERRHDDDRRDDRRFEQRRDEGWRDRDIHRFGERDFARWQHGRWYGGRHDGRAGWWWIVGDTWYFYPRPIYPYPDPYVPPAIAGAPAANAWYYCPPSQAYYPYAATCPVPWQVVPAQ